MVWAVLRTNGLCASAVCECLYGGGEGSDMRLAGAFGCKGAWSGCVLLKVRL